MGLITSGSPIGHEEGGQCRDRAGDDGGAAVGHGGRQAAAHDAPYAKDDIVNPKLLPNHGLAYHAFAGNRVK